MFRLCCNCNRCRHCCNEQYYNRSMENDDVTMEQLMQMANTGALIIDIRSPQEYNEGHINGSIVLPDYEIRRNANKIIPNKKQLIIVYCGTGIRSKKAQRLLQRMGYTNVYNLYKGTENY